MDRDEDQPKRPMSAFLLWATPFRTKFWRNHPDLSFKEVARAAGLGWRRLTAEQRKPYEDHAKVLYDNYKLANKAYLATHPKPPRDPACPKRPLTGYMLWSQRLRKAYSEEHPSVDGRQLSAMMGRAWKQLPPAQKKPYEDHAHVLADNYKLQMKLYKKTHPVVGAGGGRKPRRLRDPGEPRRPMSSFLIFNHRNRDRVLAENNCTDFLESGRLMGVAWKLLPPEEKQMYDDLAEEERKRYGRAMAEYEHMKKVDALAKADELRIPAVTGHTDDDVDDEDEEDDLSA